VTGLAPPRRDRADVGASRAVWTAGVEDVSRRVTDRVSRVTSGQERTEPSRCFPGASGDLTDARKHIRTPDKSPPK